MVEPGCYIGNGVKIGRHCHLHAGTKILDSCLLGDRVIIQAGAVIGSDGFGYAPDSSGVRHKIPQVGIVELEDDVEIGANTTIDRATFGVTKIGRGTKIDNLVQIAHNVTTGENCVIVSQSGIAGSSSIGDRVILGARSGIVGHLKIGDDMVFAGRAGVTAAPEKPGIYSGTPAIPHKEWLKMVVTQPKLPELRRKIIKLEKLFDEISDDNSQNSNNR